MSFLIVFVRIFSKAFVCVSHLSQRKKNNICAIGCSVGSLSFLVCLWLGCQYREHENPLVVKAFREEVPSSLYSWPMTAFGSAFFLNISSWVFEHHPTRRQLCFLVMYISGIAFLYEFCSWYELTPVVLTATGRPNCLLRYVMWMHATPAMIYSLSLMSEFSLKRTVAVIVGDIVMIAVALPGEFCESWVLRYAFNTLSMMLFPYVCFEMWTMFTQAMNVACEYDKAGYKSLKALRGVTILLWSVFPLVWTLCQFQLIDSFAEEMMLSLADVMGKIVFSSSLLQSNFATIDARRKIALKAAEDANRAAVIFELQELLSQKEEFIAVMTHELRTPLNGIIGLSEALLAANVLEGSNERSLGAIRNSGIRLLALVNDILDAAAMKRGTLSVTFKRVSLWNIVDDVVELTAPLVHSGVKLTTRVPAIIPGLHGDSQRLVQVLYNLVGNACKFTEKGEIRIEAKGTADDEFVSVTVSDTGPGIPESKFEEIFVPFSQSNMSLKRQHGGTGLGLSVVKHIVEAHGGTISVKSEMGKGTSFTFTIPVSPDARSSDDGAQGMSRIGQNMWRRLSRDSEARQSFEFEKSMLKKAGQQVDPEKASSIFAKSIAPLPDLETSNDVEGRLTGEPKIKKKYESPSESIMKLQSKEIIKVLSVDDDPVNQMVVNAMLKNKGFDVSTAADGERALEMVENQLNSGCPPDAILMDVMMPGLSGFDVVRSIRGSHPDWNVPILLVSASGQRQKVQEGLEAGADAYLTKPLRIEELDGIIRSHVSDAQARKIHAYEQVTVTT